MARGLVVVSLVLVAAALSASARAAEQEPRPYVVAFELGLIDSPGSLTSAGPDASVWAPPEYAGVVLDGRILPRLHLDGQVGVNAVMGLMGSLSARLAGEVSNVTISVGVGPLVASGVAWPGPAVAFADTDASAILHFSSSFVLLFRAGAAWALSNRGVPACGTDTCDTYLARGDRFTFARLGVGSSF
ncbi:MAG TPA: hypothetical protein VIK30_02075 [Polyangia bacterium]